MAVFTEWPRSGGKWATAVAGACSCLFPAAFLSMVLIKLLFYLSLGTMCISTQAGESMGYPGADGCELPFGDQTQVLWKSLQRLTFKTVNQWMHLSGPKAPHHSGPCTRQSRSSEQLLWSSSPRLQKQNIFIGRPSAHLDINL